MRRSTSATTATVDATGVDTRGRGRAADTGTLTGGCSTGGRPPKGKVRERRRGAQPTAAAAAATAAAAAVTSPTPAAATAAVATATAAVATAITAVGTAVAAAEDGAIIDTIAHGVVNSRRSRQPRHNDGTGGG